MKKRVILQSPRVWDSTWGQEKDLADVLARSFELVVLDLQDFVGRYGKLEPRYEPPTESVLVRRQRFPGPALLRAALGELANAWQQISRRADCYATYLTTGNVLAVILARLMGRKVLLIYADDLAALYGAQSRLAGWITRRICTPLVARLANAATATAELLAEDILEFAGNVSRIPNGVSLRRVPDVSPLPEGQLRVAFIGGFGHWVNFEAVLEAAAALKDVHFDLVGGGDRLEEVRGIAAGLENVSVPGRVAYEEVWRHMDAANCCIIPFFINDLTHRVSPIKLFEYWAAGRPVVVSRTVEMGSAAGDAVLYANDGSELTGQLARLRDDASLRRKLAETGRSRVAEYDWEVLGARYVEIINELTGDS